MPKFELVPQDEAVKKAATGGKRGQIMALYLFFIDQLQEGRAGRLRPSEGETVQAIRRRLGAAAKLSGKKLAIKRVGDEVYFWLDFGEDSKRKRRGRSSKSSDKTQRQSGLRDQMNF